VPRRLADTTAAERALAFRSEIDLSQGLFDLVDWWRSVRHAPNGPVFASAA
jgi:UDP-glucose 4-epimerase